MGIARYYLGCPIWGVREWSGALYTPGARGDARLEQYASVFNAVEGNGTAYGIPEPNVVQRWREHTPESFRFCFKLPQQITHELGLRGADPALAAFLQRMAPLGPRLGPFMIQLPGRFGPAELPALEAFLRRLPREFRFALELRHPALARPGPLAQRIAAWLEEFGVQRVAIDTRALRAGPADHPDVVAARHAKPDLPVPEPMGGASPIVRLIAHPLAEVCEPWLAEWSCTLAAWIAAGRTPYWFVHTPSNVQAPALARRAHQLLRDHCDVGAMPAWPGEQAPRAAAQLSLFGGG